MEVGLPASNIQTEWSLAASEDLDGQVVKSVLLECHKTPAPRTLMDQCNAQVQGGNAPQHLIVDVYIAMPLLVHGESYVLLLWHEQAHADSMRS